MKKLLFTIILLFTTCFCKADQLSYLTLEQAKIATDFLLKQSHVISWCACCSQEEKELLTVNSVYYKKVPNDDKYFQVYIYGFNLNEEKINKPFDLAYLHFNKSGFAMCVGLELGFECDPCTQPFKWNDFKSTKFQEQKELIVEDEEEIFRPTSYVFVGGKRLISGEKTEIHSDDNSLDKMSTFVSIAKENEKTMIIFWQESTNHHMNFFNEVWKGTVYIYLENGETISLMDRNKKGQNKIKNGQTSSYGYQSDLYQRFSAYYLTPSECQKLKNSNVSQISYKTSSGFEEGTTYMELTHNRDTFREQLLAIKR